MWSGIYTLLIILVGLIIPLVVIIRALRDELREVKMALENSEKRSEELERSVFCALCNVEEAKKQLSFIESGVDVKSNVKGFQASIAYRSLNNYLTRAIKLLASAAYNKIHF